MEAIAAFSLACNVFTVIQFGAETITLCKKLHRTGKWQPKLVESGKLFDAANERLQRDLDDRGNSPMTEEDRILYAISQKCREASDELLQELAELELRLAKGGWAHALSSTIRGKWKAGKIEQLQKDMELCRENLNTQLQIDSRAQLRSLLSLQIQSSEQFQEATRRLASAVQTSNEALAQTLVAKIDELTLASRSKVSQDLVLQSLFFPDIMKRFDEVSAAYAKTFEWILTDSMKSTRHSDDFAEWLKAGSGVYWISGKLGSGKSTLMQLIQRHPQTEGLLQEWASEAGLTRASFFIWNWGETLQKSKEGVLRAILYQILDSDPATINSLGLDSASRIPTWTESRLMMSLRRLLEKSSLNLSPRSFCFFLDALDELHCENGDVERSTFINELISLTEMPNVKLCVSSRPYPVFERLFRQHKRLRLQDFTHQDIFLFTSRKLKQAVDECDAPQINQPQLDQLVKQIVERAEGVFLWSKIVVAYLTNYIHEFMSYSELRDSVDQMPMAEIDTLYTHVLAKRPKINLERSSRYFELASIVDLTILDLSFVDMESRVGTQTAFHHFTSNREPTKSVIEKCNVARNRILSCSQGLLEIRMKRHSSVSDTAKINESENTGTDIVAHETTEEMIHRFDNEVIHFIHSSAKDFTRTLRSELEATSRNTTGNQTWCAPAAFALGQVRRLTSLQELHNGVWTEDSRVKYQALNYLHLADRDYRYDISPVLNALDRVLCGLYKNRDYTWYASMSDMCDPHDDLPKKESMQGPIPEYQHVCTIEQQNAIVNWRNVHSANDLVGFAVTYGFNEYVKRQKRLQTLDATYLLRCAVWVIVDFCLYHRIPGLGKSFVSTTSQKVSDPALERMSNILSWGADPNALFIPTLDPDLAPSLQSITNTSIWKIFLSCSRWIWSHSRLILMGPAGSVDLQELSQECLLNLNKLISFGADPEAKIITHECIRIQMAERDANQIADLKAAWIHLPKRSFLSNCWSILDMVSHECTLDEESHSSRNGIESVYRLRANKYVDVLLLEKDASGTNEYKRFSTKFIRVSNMELDIAPILKHLKLDRGVDQLADWSSLWRTSTEVPIVRQIAEQIIDRARSGLACGDFVVEELDRWKFMKTARKRVPLWKVEDESDDSDGSDETDDSDDSYDTEDSEESEDSDDSDISSDDSDSFLIDISDDSDESEDSEYSDETDDSDDSEDGKANAHPKYEFDDDELFGVGYFHIRRHKFH